MEVVMKSHPNTHTHCPCHEMVEAQKAELRASLDEHKWYQSEKAGHDIGNRDAQLDFIEKYMPNWGSKFRAKFCKDCKNA